MSGVRGQPLQVEAIVLPANAEVSLSLSLSLSLCLSLSLFLSLSLSRFLPRPVSLFVCVSVLLCVTLPRVSGQRCRARQP